MLQLQKKLTALVAAVLMYGGFVAPSALAVATSPNPVASADTMATLTAKSGQVWKQDFVDWQKEVWGKTETANLSDHLREGMRLGTGNNSWAEVSWPNVKTRVWSNSEFAVAPNKRLVYLTQGEMLFRLDKHRKNKDDAYYIWTKVLQARIRGTTVLVQAQGTVTRFTVIEGVVDIMNRLDKSHVTLKPGVVYEVIGYNTPGVTNTGKPVVMVPPKKLTKDVVTDILYDSSERAKTPVFQDNYASSNVYPSNSEALKTHPLINAGGTIDSMPLIEKAQAGLPGFNSLIPIKLADRKELSKVISNGIAVNGAPSTCNYFMGQSVGKTISIPPTVLSNLPPTGVVLNPADILTAPEPTVAAHPPMPIVPVFTALEQNPSAAEAKPTSEAKPTAASEVEEPLPVQPFAQPSPFASDSQKKLDQLSQPTNIQNPAASAFAPFTSAQNVSPVSSSVAGVSAAGTGAATGVSGMPVGVIAPAASAGTLMPGAISPATTVPQAFTAPTLTNTLQTTTHTLTNTLNNVTNGLNLR